MKQQNEATNDKQFFYKLLNLLIYHNKVKNIKILNLIQ